VGFKPPLQNVLYSIGRASRQRDRWVLWGLPLGAILYWFCGRVMSLSHRPVVLLGALITAGLFLFLALQVVALMLPFVLSGPYKWILVPLAIVLIALAGFLRVRKRPKESLQLH